MKYLLLETQGRYTNKVNFSLFSLRITSGIVSVANES
jgi:hypothetical protein